MNKTKCEYCIRNYTEGSCGGDNTFGSCGAFKELTKENVLEELTRLETKITSIRIKVNSLRSVFVKVLKERMLGS